MRITNYDMMIDRSCRRAILVKESARNVDYNGRIRGPEDIVWIMDHLYNADKKAEEYVWEICLNTKNEIMGIFEVSHGLVDVSVVSPREVFSRALMLGATEIMIVHNHPSGDPTPSKRDREITKAIKDIGTLMRVPLTDHIIIGDNSYYSFFGAGDFEDKEEE